MKATLAANPQLFPLTEKLVKISENSCPAVSVSASCVDIRVTQSPFQKSTPRPLPAAIDPFFFRSATVLGDRPRSQQRPRLREMADRLWFTSPETRDLAIPGSPPHRKDSENSCRAVPLFHFLSSRLPLVKFPVTQAPRRFWMDTLHDC
jgi:hypothetical protein